ncbi:MAG: cytochrome c3 family protein, partial [Vicinamibacterales bacterium]
MLTFPRPHVRRFLLLVLQALVLICAVGTVYAPSAAAQFETPNRQFHNQTAFPLEGSHRAVACESCHVRNLYKGTPTKCFDCHWVRRQDDRFRLQLGAQCEQCHQPTRWSNTRWNHSQMTGMALNGAHQQLSCQSCHKNATFKAAQAECISCHQRDYQTAQTPNHVAAGFPTDCATCHRASEASFRQSTFNHNVAFPLVGVHGQQTCASCHKNNVYLGTARDCVGCHRDAYTRTTTPNHAAAGFPTTCESCHRATDQTWRGQSFNHSSIFPLVGLHAQQTCASCHKNNVFRGTPRDCVGCHREAYTRTTTPNHVAAGFSQACETCHKPTDPSWRGPNFNHNAIFPLVGQHGQQTCASCHANNVYKGTARDCVGCHRDEYTRTTAPNHVAAAFPTTCESCHKATDQSWRGAGFNHSSVFPLLGQHAQQSCASCHKNNVYKGTARDCVGCHRDNYTRTTTPNHVAAGFPTTCESCHKATDSNWRGAGFNHSSVFPLVGQHAQQSCASCHTNNVYKGTARDCVGCHRDNYTRTTTPNHAAAGFPTTCESCHKATDSAWRGAGFNHSSVFPLVGQHASQSCASCHTNNVYKGTARDCVGCHRDDYTRTTTPNHASA